MAIVAEPKIIQKLIEGCSTTWEEILKEMDDQLWAIVRWRKWNFPHHVQEDVLQQIKSDLVKSIKNFKGDSALSTWMRQIAVRRCIDAIRTKVRKENPLTPLFREGSSDEIPGRIDAPPEWEDRPDVQLAMSERAKHLRSLLCELGGVCQNTIQSFYLEDQSYAEIADKEQISINTVGSRLSKCLNRLRDMLRENPNAREYFPAFVRQEGQEQNL